MTRKFFFFSEWGTTPIRRKRLSSTAIRRCYSDVNINRGDMWDPSLKLQ
jgi:hypothetical protein